jgi:lipoprotein-anchoring transpeptidase ErfK/SrfK
MQDGSRTGRRDRRVVFGVVGVAVSALMLVACSSGPSGSGSTNANGGNGGSGGSATTSSAPAVQIAVTPAGATPINPTTPIVVKATGGKLTSVTVANAATGAKVTGDLSADGLTWTSNMELGYKASYSVDAVGAGTDGRTNEQKSTVTTISPAKVAYPNMVPAPSSLPSVGVGQPVVFQFDQAVANKQAVQQALTVTTTPSQPGAWYWISDREVHYRAQSYWQAGTTIHVVAKVYGLDFGNGVYGAEDRDVTMHVHDSWVAKADAASSHMGIYHNGALVQTMAVSMGKDATPTHNGPHVISAKQNPYVMNSCTYGVCPPNPQAYNATEFFTERISNDGEFVHENPNSVAAQGHTNVSHGCINLNPTDAQTFFNEFGIGDVVEVTNSVGGLLPLSDTYGDWEVPWATWSAGNA